MPRSESVAVEVGGEERLEAEPLEFTGNWFIDAGILGFVNLMEEVYGWDLNELQRRIKENEEAVYYGYFPFAYLFYHSNVRGTFKKIGKIREKINKLIDNKNKKLNELAKLNVKNKEIQKLTKSEIKKLEQKIEKIKSKIVEINEKMEKQNNEIKELIKKLENDKNNLKNELANMIKDMLKDSGNRFENYRIKIKNFILDFDLNLPQDHRNFFLYNPKKDLFTSFVYLYYLLIEDFSRLNQFASEVSTKKKNEGLTYEIYPDSTVNPFLYSPTEFPNIGYTNPLSIDKIKDGLKLDIPIHLLLLSFSNAFQPPIAGKYIMFYTNNLETSYNINKRIRIYREKTGENTSIFQITWRSILDELTESKAKFSLENMYLIEFEGIENQKLKGVEFIGIPKLQASIIMDDTLRDALNVNFPTFKMERGRRIWVWILEEFIKNKPLTPHIVNYLHLFLTDKVSKKMNMIHPLAIDAQIKELNKKHQIFCTDFFNKYREIVFNIKGNAKKMFWISNIVGLFYDTDKRKRMAIKLLSTIKKSNKYAFSNMFLKILLENKNNLDNGKLKYLNNYLFEKIISNNKNWENYALAIVCGLAYGGGTNEQA